MDFSGRFPGYTSQRVLARCSVTKAWMIQVVKHGSRPSPDLAIAIERESGGAIRAAVLLGLEAHDDSPLDPAA